MHTIRQEKTTAKRVKGVTEQQRDKNTTARDEEVDFVHHPMHDCSDSDRAGEEQHAH